MKRIKFFTVALILCGFLVALADTSSRETTSNLLPVDAEQPAVDVPENPDSVCLQCIDDSISLIIKSVKRDIAKIDSISRRVRNNTRKISENNRAICVILDNCGEQDAITAPAQVAIPKDSVRIFDIEVKKK